jgi:hypothetical protein
MKGGSGCDNGSAYNHTISTLGGIGEQSAGVGNAIHETAISGSYASTGGKHGKSKRLRGLSLLRSLKRGRMSGGDCGCSSSSDSSPKLGQTGSMLTGGGRRYRKSKRRSMRKSRRYGRKY